MFQGEGRSLSTSTHLHTWIFSHRHMHTRDGTSIHMPDGPVGAYTLHLAESFPRKVKSVPLGPGHSCSCGRLLGGDERMVPSSRTQLGSEFLDVL